MLVLKKITIKKFSIYLAITVIMAAATGYLLYLNNSLGDTKPLVIDSSNRFNDYFIPEMPVISEEAAQSTDINQLKNNGGLDLSILSSEKFKKLKDNISAHRAEPNLGKRNPFQPN